jgi:hypothetical protein
MLGLNSNVDAVQRLPQGLQGENTVAWLTIYLERYDELQELVDNYLSGLLTWDQLGADTDSTVLEWIGQLLGQARPTGATDDEYRRILRVRRLVRLSCGTAPDIRAVVAELSGFSVWGATVYFVVPKTVIVTFGNFSAIAALGLSLDVVTDLLMDAIGDVDRLQVWDAIGIPFTWDTEGKGWDMGVWATPIFDSEES